MSIPKIMSKAIVRGLYVYTVTIFLAIGLYLAITYNLNLPETISASDLYNAVVSAFLTVLTNLLAGMFLGSVLVVIRQVLEEKVNDKAKNG